MIVAVIMMVVLPVNLVLAQSFVNESFAKTIGTNFIANKAQKSSPRLNLFHTEKGADGQPNLYIFNVEGGGFVIVSASKNVKPVLAYSVRNSYDGEIPETAWYFINNYSKNIDYCDDNNVMMANADIEWNLLENNELPAAKNAMTVAPLIQTMWNQDYPYNYYAPETGGGWWGGPGGHCYAGCVACAMAQIMKYWDHPVHGHGSHSYNHSTYGEQSADFENTNYNWSIMPNSLGSQATDAAKAVALLMYHCGVSVDMNFGADGSGAYSKDVETAMRMYFGYCGATYLERSKFSEEEWIALLKSELDKAQPVYFSGSSDSGSGHAIVCDGYDSNDYFSFNLGWSGSGNDYYSINDVAGFHNNEAVVVNIVPLEINADANGIIYVAADGTGDGSSWENATPYFEFATAKGINTSTMIWVKTGTYYGNTTSVDGAFNIYKNNRVYGGFAGNETPDFDLNSRDFEANPTILDGQNGHRVLYQGENIATNEAALWDGFTIQNGLSGAGGGAYLGGNSRLTNCKLLNNRADGYGGAVYIIAQYYNNSSVRFMNCVFEGNTSALGGALFDMLGATVHNCRFTNNSATAKGGAYYLFTNKECKIVNTIFDHNNAKKGAAAYSTGKMTMINCDVVENQASELGGGVSLEKSLDKLYNCILWGNTAAGLPDQIKGEATVRNCAVQGGYEGLNNIDLAADNDGSDSQDYPRFVNPESGDYSIDVNSACVDAGDKTISGVTGPDFLGNPRIVNNNVDMGAVECQTVITAVDDMNAAMFVCYPNPVENRLVIEVEGALSIDVYNLVGQKIASMKATDKAVIDATNWESGVYLVRINGVTKKIMK